VLYTFFRSLSLFLSDCITDLGFANCKKFYVTFCDGNEKYRQQKNVTIAEV
jgi:hypothetical protein